MNGAASLVKTLASAGGRLLRQPGHLGDASRRGARPGRGNARARAVRGRCDGRGRRLCAHGGQAGFDPSTSGARTRQRARQRAQRPARRHADGQHRRRPRDLPRAVRRTTHLRRRGGVARPFSDWVRTSVDSRSVARDGAAAVAAAMAPPGRVATLIVPADASWNEADGPAPLPPVERRAPVAPETISDVSRSCAPASPRSCLWVGMPCVNRA